MPVSDKVELEFHWRVLRGDLSSHVNDNAPPNVRFRTRRHWASRPSAASFIATSNQTSTYSHPTAMPAPLHLGMSTDQPCRPNPIHNGMVAAAGVQLEYLATRWAGIHSFWDGLRTYKWEGRRSYIRKSGPGQTFA
jgi:hypothetical protein